ncbi:MAG: hypothetical protein WCG75_10340, partial [Armatimonadota bacterium]
MNIRILAVIITAIVVGHVHAQSKVSDATWAKEAVTRHKIVGIDANQKTPSKRRTALYAFMVCQKIVEQANFLGKKIEALEKLVNDKSSQEKWTDEETKFLRAKVSELRTDLQVARSWSDDCDHLRHLLTTHKTQFRELGIDTFW